MLYFGQDSSPPPVLKLWSVRPEREPFLTYLPKVCTIEKDLP